MNYFSKLNFKDKKRKIKLENFIEILARYLDKDSLVSVLQDLNLFDREIYELLDRIYNNNINFKNYSKDSSSALVKLLKTQFENYERRLLALEQTVEKILDTLDILEEVLIKSRKR